MEILSVGIDIGTTTTQLIFSRLVIENKTSAFTVPRISIVSKEIIYRSRAHFTPFVNELDIDGEAIWQLVADEFAAAGLRPTDIATGAVIITGEAARKSNAEIVLNRLSRLAGDFVVSTAGPDLESIIAGRGSGACEYSRVNKCAAINADIGGGTTNIAVFVDGEPTSCCCLDIGGRQVRIDDEGRIEYISPSARAIAASMGLSVAVGQRADSAQLRQLTDRMAQLIVAQIEGRPEPLLEEVRTKSSGALTAPQTAPVIFLSGGVADCTLNPGSDAFAFGDIGILLGRSLRESPLFASGQVQHSQETLRATVVGAGVHLMSISGSTITFTPGLLPRRDIPVLMLNEEEMARWQQGDDDYVAERLAWFAQATVDTFLALGWAGWRNPRFTEITALAQRVAAVYERPPFKQLPIILIIEEDMAKALGQCLRRLLPDRQLICVDGIGIHLGDYVDLGAPIMHDMAIPVVVKTLVIG